MTKPSTKHYKFLLLAAILLLLAHAYWTPQRQAEDMLLRASDGKRVSLRAALEDLSAARLVFIGELHDQLSHHAAQLRLIQLLRERGRSFAVGLEMFRADQQEILDAWVSGELSLEEFLPVYYANWNFPWAYYGDIFMYARQHKVPMLGLNVSQGLIQQVSQRGFSSLSAEQTAQLPAVQCAVDQDYEEFIRRALGMHGSHSRSFTYFCEAQLMWDSVMAVHLLDFLELNPDHGVVVLAGRGHAWKRGIPAQVSKREKVEMRVIIPRLPPEFRQADVQTEDADYFWLGLELR